MLPLDDPVEGSLSPDDPAGAQPRRDHRFLARVSRHEEPKTPGEDAEKDIRPRQGVALISEPTEDQGSQGSTLFPILINYISVLLIGCLHLLPLLAKSHADMVLLLVLNVFVASGDSIATDRLGEVAFLP